MGLSFIRGFFAGAAPVPLDVCNRLYELTGKEIINVYGLTECNPFACISPWRGKIKPETVGLPVANTDIRIVDIERGEKEMATGEAGEILIKGPQVMAAYKIPRKIYFIEELPKSTIGKILRRELRVEAAEDAAVST